MKKESGHKWVKYLIGNIEVFHVLDTLNISSITMILRSKDIITVVYGLYLLFLASRNLNKLSTKLQSYPKSNKIDAFEQKKYAYMSQPYNYYYFSVTIKLSKLINSQTISAVYFHYSKANKIMHPSTLDQ